MSKSPQSPGGWEGSRAQRLSQLSSRADASRSGHGSFTAAAIAFDGA